MFDEVVSDDTSTAGIAKFLSELFTCFQNIRSIVRKRQQQLKLIREAERQASADPTRMNAAEQREMEKRMREQDARSMMDMRFVSAPLPHTHPQPQLHCCVDQRVWSSHLAAGRLRRSRR